MQSINDQWLHAGGTGLEPQHKVLVSNRPLWLCNPQRRQLLLLGAEE